MVVTMQLEGTPTWGRRRRIGHYGGALDKANSFTEAVPYGWRSYIELRAMRPSVYSSETGDLVDAENMCLARSSAARMRAGEKLAANGIPSTSDERLEDWVKILAVPSFPDDTRQDLRVRCSAFYKLTEGAADANVDLAVAELLGNNFVRNWRARGSDLATPPPQTFNETGVLDTDPLALWRLAGQRVWLSERAHLTVEVRMLQTQSLSDFLRLVNVELYQLLDRMLPSDMTFNWAIDVDTGFVLDVGQLDFTGFGYA